MRISVFSDVRLYLVAPHKLKAGRAEDLIAELASAGVGAFQLREKDMEAADVIRVGTPIAEACRTAGIPFIVNDRPDIALALGASGVHLGQNDVPVNIARRLLPSGLVGRSIHSNDDLERVLDEDVDYFAAGPVFATPTKPGRPAAGLEYIEEVAVSVSATQPWFAIGGINGKNLPKVIEAGARRIVVVRAVAGAKDPVAAAARLAGMLALK
ncbi:MAG TPA: thiamine phosphate synthase [Actinomycetota bacterium]|nr:thiamine phosphate synthase [Actinomycetota bacterium]